MKKVFTFIVVISLALVLIAGCKPEEKKGFSPTGGQAANTTTTPETPVETTPTQPAVTETKNETTTLIINDTPTTPVTPAPPLYVNDSYYAGLYDMCNKGSSSPSCCNQSVDKMKAGGFIQPTGLDCETGYGANRLSCMGSLRWCELVDQATLGQFYCNATAECTPKPECHPKECINKEYAVNYVKPAECPLPYYVDRAYSNSDCECINHKCTNKKA